MSAYHVPGTPTALLAAKRLRAVATIIEQDMPDGRDRVDCLRRLGLAISALENNSAAAICRRCGSPFSYNGRLFLERRLNPPKHCYHCRAARRAERDASGMPFPEEDPR